MYCSTPQFLFIYRWIVQNYAIQRQIKRNGGKSIEHVRGARPSHTISKTLACEEHADDSYSLGSPMFVAQTF
jgi:hypothetical protein